MFWHGRSTPYIGRLGNDIPASGWRSPVKHFVILFSLRFLPSPGVLFADKSPPDSCAGRRAAVSPPKRAGKDKMRSKTVAPEDAFLQVTPGNRKTVEQYPGVSRKPARKAIHKCAPVRTKPAGFRDKPRRAAGIAP